MNESAPESQDVDPAVASYKRLLKESLDRRPSGTRQRLAAALGTHKSFVSQITNPNLRIPLPVQHVRTIFRICHFSHEEQQAFLQAYRQAHPNQSLPDADGGEEGARVLRIEVPRFDDPKHQEDVIETIYEFAARVIALARRKP
jgi:hypothetical protein